MFNKLGAGVIGFGIGVFLTGLVIQWANMPIAVRVFITAAILYAIYELYRLVATENETYSTH